MNKGITITLTDKRDIDDKGQPRTETFHSQEGLKNSLSFRWKSKPIIGHVISMENEKGEIPVEVALIYNESYTEISFLM